MSKRKWTRIEVYETEIIRLREADLVRQEIADELDLDQELDKPIQQASERIVCQRSETQRKTTQGWPATEAEY